MNINNIIKIVITRLKKSGKPLTPEYYMEEFCKEAKRHGVLVEDCAQIDRAIERLSPALKRDIATYNIRNIKELLSLLTSKLNRIGGGETAGANIALFALIKHLLNSISLLHNQKASSIVKNHLKQYDDLYSIDEIERMSEKWSSFSLSYDDSFLDSLKPFVNVNKSDFSKTVLALDRVLNLQDVPTDDIASIAEILAFSLTPSISKKKPDAVLKATMLLLKEPLSLLNGETKRDISSAIDERIDIDRKQLKDTIITFDAIVDKVSKQLIAIIEKSGSSNEEIRQIKDELLGVEASYDGNVKKAHDKLLNIARSLERETSQLGENMESQHLTIKSLQVRVKELEGALESARQQSHEDFLTKLLNKRAIENILQRLEVSYKRNSDSFSIIMLDIDHFKQVNDKYGHSAGDIVLKEFAQVVKEHTREVDVVGRWGGEEFMLILPKTDKNGTKKFIIKLLDSIRKAKFVYKSKVIPITASAGYSSRREFTSLEATVEASDKALYRAKEFGRDQAISA